MLRKIMTKEEIEKRDSKRKMVISVILALIMLFSTAGYFVFDFSSGKSGKIIYKDTEFKQADYGGWAFSVQGYDFQTAYNPFDTANTTITSSKTLSDYNNQPVYLASYAPEEYDVPGYASSEIIRNLGVFIARSNTACISESSCENLDYPVKNCSLDNVIVFKKAKEGSNISRISDLEKCVVLEYDPAMNGAEEKTADAFIFKIIGL